MSRRKGRVLAFQALYSYDMGNASLEELLKLEWTHSEPEEPPVSAEEKKDEKNTFITGETQAEEEAPATDSEVFARLIIAGTINHLAEIDEIIKKHLSAKWDFERLNRVSLAILRISTYSLMYQKEIFPSIVIDEAVAIAKEFGADDAFKFINAVLDNIRKELTA